MEWDLIGVAGIPEAADEYDCMISPLLRWLAGRLDQARAVISFRCRPDDAADTRLAESLAAWWERRRTEAT